MKLRKLSQGFTLIELLVVISIIAILASFAIPASVGVLDKAKQAGDLSQARNVYTALLSFAGDHDGGFPSQPDQDGAGGTVFAQGASANAAYANLVPRYIATEKTFYVANSAFCSAAPPDENIGTGEKLKAGENNYAYITGLTSSSNPNYPIVADGMNNTTTGAYSAVQTDNGGVWKGQVAIVVRVGGSAARELLNTDKVIMGNTGQTAKKNIFVQDATNADNPWLSAKNIILNPSVPQG